MNSPAVALPEPLFVHKVADAAAAARLWAPARSGRSIPELRPS